MYIYIYILCTYIYNYTQTHAFLHHGLDPEDFPTGNVLVSGV